VLRETDRVSSVGFNAVHLAGSIQAGEAGPQFLPPSSCPAKEALRRFMGRAAGFAFRPELESMSTAAIVQGTVGKAVLANAAW